MFKKHFISRFLSVVLLFGLFPSACAQDSVYIPAQAVGRFVRNAFLSGQMICADAAFSPALNAGMFGISREDEEQLDLICEILSGSTLTVGAVQIPGGVALMLRAAYGAEPVSADIILSVTADGAAIETSLLPGERLFVSWEALLREAGLDAQTADATMLSLRSAGPEQFLLLLGQSLALSKTALSIAAAPYKEIVRSFIVSLPETVQHNVAAEGHFPAAARESAILITQKAASELLIALCAQLEQDVLLTSTLDAVLAEVLGDPSLDTAALCAAVRDIASTLTDEEYPLCLITGYNDAGMPLYGSLCISDADGVTYALNLIDMQQSVSETESGRLLQAFLADAQTYTGLTASFFFAGDPLDPNIRTFGAAAEFQLLNEFVFSGEYILDTQAVPAADGRLVYDSVQEYALDALVSGSVLSFLGDSHTEYGPTNDGEEYCIADSTAEGYLGEVLIMQTDSQSSFSITSTEDGFRGLFAREYAAPQQGIDKANFTLSLYTQPYASDADTSILILDSASSEAIDAMLLRLQKNAEAMLDALQPLLPGAI